MPTAAHPLTFTRARAAITQEYGTWLEQAFDLLCEREGLDLGADVEARAELMSRLASSFRSMAVYATVKRHGLGHEEAVEALTHAGGLGRGLPGRLRQHLRPDPPPYVGELAERMMRDDLEGEERERIIATAREIAGRVRQAARDLRDLRESAERARASAAGADRDLRKPVERAAFEPGDSADTRDTSTTSHFLSSVDAQAPELEHVAEDIVANLEDSDADEARGFLRAHLEELDHEALADLWQRSEEWRP